MANRFFQAYKQALGVGNGPDLTDGTVFAVLIDTADHDPDTAIAGDDFMDDIPAAARVSTTAVLGNPTVVDGVFDADDATLPDSGGDEAEEIVIAHGDGSAESAQLLLAVIDTATGLPITPDSTDDSIAWSGSGIFAL